MFWRSPSRSRAATRAEDCRAEGNQAFSAKRYSTALEHYSAGLCYAPNSAVLYSNRCAPRTRSAAASFMLQEGFWSRGSPGYIIGPCSGWNVVASPDGVGCHNTSLQKTSAAQQRLHVSSRACQAQFWACATQVQGGGIPEAGLGGGPHVCAG